MRASISAGGPKGGSRTIAFPARGMREPTVDAAERARREQDRILKARERLRFRVFSAVRERVLATELFRSHYELHEPEITVNVYTQFVDAATALTEGQLRLLPASTRSRDLHRFADELRSGMEKVAEDLDLELSTDPARFGGSQPVSLVDVPYGYRAVFVRAEPE